jgi:quercetin dioxygenase-like cupin family protein
MASTSATDIAPHVYRSLFENERVRLLEVRMGPGDETKLHSHPDTLVHVLQGGRIQWTPPSGEAAEIDLEPGFTVWSPAQEHSAANSGTSEFLALFVEFK